MKKNNEEMKKYGDIIERIMEIISLSEKKKRELSPEELKANFNKHFAYILYNDIDVDLASEFKELIDAERTFMQLKQASPLSCLDKTKQLLFDCKENSNPSINNSYIYEELAQIITDSYGKSAFLLTEYKGYYILRERLNRFLWLMRKANLFVDEKTMTEEQRRSEVNRILYENHEQYDRLREYIEQAKMIDDKKKKNGPQIIDINSTTGIRPNFRNKVHSDLILLGLYGKLTTDMVERLRISYSDEEYQELIDELAEWDIFSQEELAKLRNAESKSIVVTNNFDELFAFFATKKISDASAQTGSISQEIYEEYLTQEFGVDTKLIKRA